MLLPPVIERELRTASRRATTYWTRLGACLAAILPFAPFLLMLAIGARFGTPVLSPQHLGPIFFGICTFIAGLTAILAGWFFASDAISYERREGTLELLFLAPLGPVEIVLGKLVSVSWRGAQWLLAVVPLFAFPILLGGVRGSDLATLALLAGNTLLWSMASSLWASSRRRGLFESLVLAAVTQGALTGLPFLVDLALAGFDPSLYVSRLGLSSPLYGWTHGFSRRTTLFWISLGIVHLQAWAFLALTVRAAAREIRQNPSARGPGLFERFNNAWKYGRPRTRVALRRRLLDTRPIRWLVERERGPVRFLIALPLILVVSVTAIALVLGESGALFALGSVATLILSGAIAILLALQASRFLAEARRTGALELMLVSPLSSKTILVDQCASMFRTFAFPVGLLLACEIGIALAQRTMLGSVAAPPPGAPPAAVSFAAMASFQWLGTAVSAAVALSGYVALAWVGFWMGLVCRQVSIALFATLAIAKLVPMVLVSSAQSMTLGLLLGGRIPPWMPFVVSGMTGILLNLGLVLVARHQLLPDLRRILDSPMLVLWPKHSVRPPPSLKP